MRFLGSVLVVLGVACFASGCSGADKMKAGHLPAEVLLVYNADSPISTAIASDYSSRRGVKNKLAIHCADSALSAQNETISLHDYTAEIATPVAAYLKQHPGINFIVLTKGVPIRVNGGITGSHDENFPSSAPLNASVDSYLAAIDYPELTGAVKISIHGSGARGFGWLNRYWKSARPFSHAEFGGYLVTRLDGLTAADAESLVTHALAADVGKAADGKILLDVQPDFGIDSNVAEQPLPVTGTITEESDYGSWNADLVKAGSELAALKIPTDLDKNEAFVGGQANLLGYFSWGSNDPKFTDKAYDSLTFAPGAIGDTAVSTSARTFLPASGGQSLITVLIANGITGVKGYTDEPLLQAIASPSVTMERYTAGFTLAESLYAASRFVGWTDVVIGDPLATAPATLRKSVP
jgi:uncharacterized protein (TIGR03790 family)